MTRDAAGNGLDLDRPRRSGLSVPLFSLVTAESWGIGEFRDLVTLVRWGASAGQSVVQILPVMELPIGEHSPYSALSSMALDPTYIALDAVADFQAIGGELAFASEDRLALEHVRQAPRIAYDEVRRLKQKWLRQSWDRFLRLEMPQATPRARHFRAFCERERWWLDTYAVFRSLLALHENFPWWQWPDALAHPDEAVETRAAGSLHLEVEFRKYLQWLAAGQWADARRLAWPTRIFGDLPFMISGNSADVWRRQPQFHLDATVGAPPDAFAADGQDWGLPPWRADAMRADGFRWMQDRARRHAELFDGFRVDHLVGLYRAWIRPLDRSIPAHFEPANEADQLALGETLLGIFQAGGAEIIAEDLGTIPPFVRDSLARLGVPGFKVLRFEREWDAAGQPPIDPSTFPALSVATTGTHDLEPLAAIDADDVGRSLADLLGAGSYLTLIPLQDAFGWADRINTPSVIDEQNWTWKVPRPVDAWFDWPEAIARAARVRELTVAAGRAR
jgi:4-alpha-glucanotransferase